jgi:hypothetical protein
MLNKKVQSLQQLSIELRNISIQLGSIKTFQQIGKCMNKRVSKLLACCSLLLLTSKSNAGPGVSSGDQPSFLPELICGIDRQIMDATMTTSFQDIYGKLPMAELSLPTGETTVEVVYGYCKQIVGADELAFECDMNHKGVSYKVGLYSTGTSQLYSSVAKGDDTILKSNMLCEEVQAKK